MVVREPVPRRALAPRDLVLRVAALPDLARRGLARRGLASPAGEIVGARQTRHRILEIVAFLLVAGGIGATLGTWRSFFDLKVYWGAVHYWTHGGSIYDFVSPDSTYGFTYTPFAALVMLPLAILPWPVAIALSCVAITAVAITVIRWFVEPIAQRHGWTRWYTVAAVAACAAAFDPLRETFLFGQVNMYLVGLVGFDLLFLTRRGSRFAGVGIGLAAALKLTPGVFIGYLLVTKRWRAALTATSAAAGATLFAAALAPDASRIFWTDALWNTDRVGQLDYISNQSLNGAVARLHPSDPSMLLWLSAVAVVLAIWAVRARKVTSTGDDRIGFALTGIVTCLVSPITWVHHLVWIMPSLLLLLDRGLDRSATAPLGGRRARLWTLLLVSYVILGSRVVWAFDGRGWDGPAVWFASNAYVWVSIALLIGLPVASAPVPTPPTPTTAPPAAPDVTAPAPDVTAPAPVGAGSDLDRAMASLLHDERVSAAEGVGPAH